MARLAEIQQIFREASPAPPVKAPTPTPLTRLIGTEWLERFLSARNTVIIPQAITAVDTGTETFTIAGDFTDRIFPFDTMEVFGSSGNNFQFTISAVVENAGDTEITVDQNVTSAVADGELVLTDVNIESEGVVEDEVRLVSMTTTDITAEVNAASSTNTLTAIELDILAVSGLSNPPNNPGGGLQSFNVNKIYEVREDPTNSSQSFIYYWEERDSLKPSEFLVDETLANIKSAANG